MRYLAIFLAGCACDFTVQGICVVDETSSIDAKDVRRAVEAVEDKCSLSFSKDLTVRFLKEPPKRDCGVISGCTPIPGQYDPEETTALVWPHYYRPWSVLRHELIHAGLDFAGTPDDLHDDPSLWCAAEGGDNSCEARAAGGDCWAE